MKDLNNINNENVNENSEEVKNTEAVNLPVEETPKKMEKEQVSENETVETSKPIDEEIKVENQEEKPEEIVVPESKDVDTNENVPNQVEAVKEETVATETKVIVKDEKADVAKVEAVIADDIKEEVVVDKAEVIVEDEKADDAKVEPVIAEATKDEVVAEKTEVDVEKEIADVAKEEQVVAVKVKEETLVVSDKIADDENIDENSIENFIENDEELAEEDKKIDYSTFSKEELVKLIAEKIESSPIQDIKYDVDNIKSNFYKLHKIELDLAKKKFVADGGDPAEYVYEMDSLEENLKIQLNEYKRLKFEFNKKLELEKEDNLKKKYAIIEAIKNLINGQESINKTYNDFRELQQQWRNTGLVPQTEVRNLWENYHHNVEQFYGYIKINRELRDLDLKKNLETKVKLCEQAEELLMEPSVVKAFKQLQKLHELWREIGPVPNENREDVWERFKSSTTTINKSHQDYFENLKQEQTNNLNAKIAICEKVEELANLTLDKHKDWELKSDELIEVQKLWKTIGFATKKENNKIFERFRVACDMFFNKKRDFYLEHKEVQNNNLQLKTELCIQAEAIKDNNDWKKTSNELIKLQKDWKEIGPVPRKLSDAIWKRFRASCNEFFERKEKYFANIDKEYGDNLKAKQDLINQVKNFVSLENIEANINALKEYQKQWTEIGHVPFKQKDIIQKEFRDSVNAQFDKLKIDSDKRSVLIYKQRIENMSQGGGSNSNRQYRVEKDRILDGIRRLESDIVLLENNIGFFAKTKNAESLIKDVNNKIEKSKNKIKLEKQKLNMLNKMD